MKEEIILFKKQISLNIDGLDAHISKLVVQLYKDDISEEKYQKTVDKIDELVKLRSVLSDSRNKESIMPIVVSGALQLAGILVVLKYEKTDVIVSKAYGMATNMFKRGV